MVQDDLLVEHVKEDYKTAELSTRERYLCHFAEKLTLHPSEMKPEDLDQLRDIGISDSEIHDAVQIISYFNYINRLADALGCDSEEWMKEKK